MSTPLRPLRDSPDPPQDLKVTVVRVADLRTKPATPTVAPASVAHPRRVTSPTPAASPAASRLAGPNASPPRRRLLSVGGLFSAAVILLLYLGWHLPTEHYITPKRGLGYALGIIGGSLMLLLLVYSLRKRYAWLGFLGPTPSWFRFHMVLGVLGPLCILYHSNFSTGATNSNVALFSMLAVAGSGLIGRYIYAHVHHGLYGSKVELGELRAGADGLRGLSGSIGFLPELVTRIEAAERRLLSAGPKNALLGFTKPVLVALAAMGARWRLHGYVGEALRSGARKSAVLASERKRLRSTACAYVDRRIAATRRVAGFEGYERLFSLWHALHVPLIFMMILAAVIHIIAVHVY